MCHMGTYSNLRLEVLSPLAAKKISRIWAVTPLITYVAFSNAIMGFVNLDLGPPQFLGRFGRRAAAAARGESGEGL